MAGGITETKKIAANAETYNLHVQPHNCHGPIATAAAVQLDACMTNFIVQELVPFRDAIAYEIVNEPLECEVVDGLLPVLDRPGLGVTLNEDLISRCPRLHVEV
jgi:galactonate dehydratase